MTHQIIPILCNEKHMANYAYLITTDNSTDTIIIDAAEANPILAELEQRHLTPTHILTTHHHFDHVEGNIALKEKYNCEIIAPEKEFNKIPGATLAVPLMIRETVAAETPEASAIAFIVIDIAASPLIGDEDNI